MNGRRPSSKAIAEQNRCLLSQYQNFQTAATYVAGAFFQFEVVKKVLLFGSVAKPLCKEVPRFWEYRKWNIEVWHECKDVDLAVWLSDLGYINTLQKVRGQALNALLMEKNIGVAHHQVDIFIMEPGTDHYLGRMCIFGQCPKGKADCDVPGCGNPKFLRQIAEFTLNQDVFADGQCKILFAREPL